jgi:hypothetical protein
VVFLETSGFFLSVTRGRTLFLFLGG